MNKKLLLKLVFGIFSIIIGGLWYYFFKQFSNTYYNYNYLAELNLLLISGFLFFVSFSLLLTPWPVNLPLGTTLGSIYMIIIASRLLKWVNFYNVVQPDILIGGIILVPSLAIFGVSFFYKYIVGEVKDESNS